MKAGRPGKDRLSAIAQSKLILEHAKLNPPNQIAHPTKEQLTGAPCRKGDPERFFPDTDVAAANLAMAECWRCPFRSTCLEAAIALREDADTSGIWGATLPIERRRMRQAA